MFSRAGTFSYMSFGEWALWACLVLVLKHTFRNMICILEPSEWGQIPPIQNVLEGRHFFAVGFPGVGTMGRASISVETYFQEYNMYFRAIRQMPEALDPKCSRGQALFPTFHWGLGFLWCQALSGSFFLSPLIDLASFARFFHLPPGHWCRTQSGSSCGYCPWPLSIGSIIHIIFLRVYFNIYTIHAHSAHSWKSNYEKVPALKNIFDRGLLAFV